VAIKERIRERKQDIEAWKKEIEIFKRLEKEIPTLVTPRIICTLDDTPRKIKEKYIVLEVKK
jgi:hypothetical protein